jgi:hypothetical protein
LLPEYNDEETSEMVEILDTWYSSEDWYEMYLR